MLPPSTFKSRPTYQPLQPASGPGRHWLLLEAQSVDAALGQALAQAFAPVQARLQTWWVGGAAASTAGAAAVLPVQALAAQGLGPLPEQLPDLNAVAQALAQTHPLVSDRLYVQGSEPFVWAVVQAAGSAGWRPEQWQLAHAGSLQRRVWCTHCHQFTENVSTSIVTCAGCARHLLVRDHFSKRHGAFMGVMVDAEAPGEVPQAEEIFP